MIVQVINPWIVEPNYSFCTNPHINALMNMIMDNHLPFPKTSAGYLKLLEVFVGDREKNVSEEEQLKHICDYLGIEIPSKQKYSIKSFSPTRTCSTAESYRTAEERIPDSFPETSKHTEKAIDNSFDATPKVVSRLKKSARRVFAHLPVKASDEEDDDIFDFFNEPISELNDEELEIFVPKSTAHSSPEEKSDGHSRKRKTSFSYVSDISSSSDSDDNVSVLSLTNIIGAMEIQYPLSYRREEGNKF